MIPIVQVYDYLRNLAQFKHLSLLTTCIQTLDQTQQDTTCGFVIRVCHDQIRAKVITSGPFVGHFQYRIKTAQFNKIAEISS